MTSIRYTFKDQVPLLFAHQTWLVLAPLGVVVSLWSAVVNREVPAPYLDEVFHVGQARRYLLGRYLEWDPKITTPPGLYGLSCLLHWMTGFDSVAGLRVLNAILLPLLVLLITNADANLCRQTSGHRCTSQHPSLLTQRLHLGLNVALFPPLFFFSALYYTDVASVVSVLICWTHFVRLHDRFSWSIRDEVLAVVLGIASLTFRQTNIFWVAVFPAGLLFTDRLDRVVKEAIRDGEPILEPAVREAHADDYLFFVSSRICRVRQGASALLHGDSSILCLLRMLVPYLVILGTFGGFVVWNGGVVLGDKSNHVATIHLTQMLYIWPYMAFFSVPLMYPYLLQGIFASLGLIPGLCRLEYMLMYARRAVVPRSVMPRSLTLLVFVVVAAVIVRFNTIVHPFTLADNRHYPFYVFRRLLAHPSIRYLVVPVYATAAWATIQTLGAPAELSPVAELATGKDDVGDDGRHALDRNGFRPKSRSVSKLAHPPDPSTTTPSSLNDAASGQGAKVSFVLVWLLTSALQLVTAPLVEPRYFILPWVMWRIRVPQTRTASRRHRRRRLGGMSENVRAEDWLVELKRQTWDERDKRLWLETAWFLLINGLTGYVFLHRGFEWEQEKGVVQRFMW